MQARHHASIQAGTGDIETPTAARPSVRSANTSIATGAHRKSDELTRRAEEGQNQLNTAAVAGNMPQGSIHGRTTGRGEQANLAAHLRLTFGGRYPRRSCQVQGRSSEGMPLQASSRSASRSTCPVPATTHSAHSHHLLIAITNLSGRAPPKSFFSV